MAKLCMHCGEQIAEDANFCPKCGRSVSAVNAEQAINISSDTKKKGKGVNPLIIKIACALGGILYAVIRFAIVNSEDTVIDASQEAVDTMTDTSQEVVDAACKKIKSEVYSTYHEIPNVSGELIYKVGDKDSETYDYIVVVRYETPKGWIGSYACLVWGFGSNDSNPYVRVQSWTKEKSYDFDYKAVLDELKALWELD